MQTLNLMIDGMTCGGCTTAIKNALQNAGVAKADIDLSSRQASIVYDEALLNPAMIVDVIEEAGFDVVSA